MPGPPTSPAPADRSSPAAAVGGEEVAAAVRRVFAPHLADEPGGRLGRVWRSWRATLRMLRPLGAVSLGNRVEVYSDGDRVFRAMWAAIDGARREVLMTSYLLAADRVGRRPLEALTEAAARGCEVTLVIDAFGSSHLDDGDLEPLRRAGGRVHTFNPMLRWHTPISRLVRNHQKILTVDGHVGFAGGMNVGEDYAGTGLGNGRFRDTHVRLQGPCVPELGALVTAAAEEVASAVASLPDGASADAGAPHEGGCLVQILESNVRRHRRAIQKALRTTVARSVQHCFLTTPYFVPPRRLVRALLRAAKRGVDVRILTAGRSDVYWVQQASQHLYGRVLRHGVRIFEYERATLHSKTMTVDRVYAAVGSFNLDHWSDRRNLEVNVSFLDEGVALELEQAFHEDLSSAREVTLDDWTRRTLWQRFKQWVAYQLLSL